MIRVTAAASPAAGDSAYRHAPHKVSYAEPRITDWGFFGTARHHADPEAAWTAAFAAIARATQASPEGVRDFLDSRHGLHFADDVANGLARGKTLQRAIDAAVTRWMGWTIDRRTARDRYPAWGRAAPRRAGGRPDRRHRGPAPGRRARQPRARTRWGYHRREESSMSRPELSRNSTALTVRAPFAVRKCGGRKLVVAPDGAAWAAPRPRVDNTLVKALARAFRWKRMLESGRFSSLAELAEHEQINTSYLSRILRLTLLAPDVVEAIVDGRQPAGMQLATLLKPFPVEWEEQRRTLVLNVGERLEFCRSPTLQLPGWPSRAWVIVLLARFNHRPKEPRRSKPACR